MVNMTRWPSQAAGRWPDRSARHALQQSLRDLGTNFDAVWIDGLHAAATGRWLANELKVPYFYRSHNIEHRYLAEQAKLASGKNKISIVANLLGLKRFEYQTLSNAGLFFDISPDDLKHWERQGLRNGRLLLPLMAPERGPTGVGDAQEETISDVAFVGSLSSPNNVAAVEWYVRLVQPKVLERVPDARLLVAGRRPSERLDRIVSGCGGRLIANPQHVGPLLAGSNVVINPIHHGSGVNLKMIELFESGRPVVSTPKGVRGFPSSLVSEVDVASDPADFADCVVRNIIAQRANPSVRDRSGLLEANFGISALKRAAEEAEDLLQFSGRSEAPTA